jgi:hypothetical protein
MRVRGTLIQSAVLSAVRIPNRYLGTLLVRGAALWALARALIIALAMFIAAAANLDAVSATDIALGTNVVLATWRVIMSAALVLVDLYRRHELALLSNLGVTTASAVALGVIPAGLIEVTLLRF